MSCSRNDVILVPIPFSDLSSRKVRPAMVIGKNRFGDLFVVPLTTQARNIDVQVKSWKAAGLNAKCGIKAQLATIEPRLVQKVIGQLVETDQSALDGELRSWLDLN